MPYYYSFYSNLYLIAIYNWYTGVYNNIRNCYVSKILPYLCTYSTKAVNMSNTGQANNNAA